MPPALRPLVVIPTYNNRPTLPAVAQGALAAHPDVLVVDDGSTDGALETLGSLAAERLILESNQGKGAAILAAAGWAEARGFTHLITLDADGQHDPREIPRFLERLPTSPWAILTGTRALDGPAVPRSSRFGRAFSNFWVRLAAGSAPQDSQSGFRAYPVAALRALAPGARRYDFEVEILVRAAWAGLALESLPVSAHYAQGAAYVSHFRPVLDNARISWTFTRLVTRRLIPWPHAKLASPAQFTPAAGAPASQYRSPDYGGRLGHAIFHAVIRWTGVHPAYALLALIIPYYVLLRPAARRSAEPYLRRRFPRQGALARLLATFIYFYRFGQVLIDQGVIGILGPQRLRVEFSADSMSEAQLHALAQAGRGLILLTTHTGHWRTAMATMGHLGVPVHFQFQLEPHMTGRHFFDLAGQRERFHFVSPAGFLGGVVELTAALRTGEAIAVMGDRAFGAQTLPAPFLGQEAFFPALPYQLALTTGAPLVMLLALRTGRLRARIEAVRLGAGLDLAAQPREAARHALLAEYSAALERTVAKYPFMWFNFFDIWKHTDRPPHATRRHAQHGISTEEQP